MSKSIRSQTVIALRWKGDNSIEVFVNLGKLYAKYGNDDLGVSRFTLDRRDLVNEGYENDLISLRKLEIN